MKKHLQLSLCALIICLAAAALLHTEKVRADEGWGYIFPDADTRYLTEEELYLLSPQVLSYGKNEIYARHGRLFASQELMDYFNSTSWYQGWVQPSAFSDSVFNEYEYANIMLIDSIQMYNAEYQYALDMYGYNFDEIYRYFNNEAEGCYYADRYAAYADILLKYADQIRAYTWQCMGGEPLERASCVAFADLTWDTDPELIYMSRPVGADIGYLSVWGFQDGHPVLMLQKGFDYNAGGGCRYDVFQSGIKGGLSIYTSSGDEIWTDEISEYHEDAQGRLSLAGQATHISAPTGDYMYYLKQTYILNGEETDEDTYRQILDYVWEERANDLVASWYGDSLGELPGLPSPVSMTLDEALASLGASGQTQSSSPELSAYNEYITDNIDLFTEHNEHFGYCLLDVDADGTDEIFVLYPSGNRYAMRAYTFDGGWVKSIIDNDEGGVVYGVGGVHCTNAGRGVVFSFFSGASMTDYIFCYMNNSRLDAYYQLSCNSETGQYYVNGETASEEYYEDYMGTFSQTPMDVISFR